MTTPSFSPLVFRKDTDKPLLRNMSVLRRVLHLIWEVVWPYEIVWNSDQKTEQGRTIGNPLHEEKH